MAKRGRKPKNVDKNYFGETQETAAKRYRLIMKTLKKNGIVPETEEKLAKITDEDIIGTNLPYDELMSLVDESHDIYNNILKHAFEKMIESIIRRYHLYVPDESFDDTFNDALSFLLTKADMFDPSKGKRAYSYYGNTCKNYLIGRNETYTKNAQRNPSYDLDEEEFTNNAKYANKVDRNERIATSAVDKMITRIGTMIENPEEYGLKENEVKLGKALKNLFENWDFVLSTDGSNKLNKNAVLFFLKEQTKLDAKGIRDNMKKYKKEFLIIKDALIN